MTENLLPGIELMNGDCAAVLPELPPAHLVRTSPPYDHLREYGGYNDAFDFDAIAAACVANLAPGGVLVWVVADQIVAGAENGTSFRPALGFKALKLTLHQTLFDAAHYRPIDQSRALRGVQYMFVFAKGKPMVANIPIDHLNVKAGMRVAKSYAPGSSLDGSRQSASARVKDIADFGKRGPIWRSAAECGFDIWHPAVFPYALASDHIIAGQTPAA